MIWTDIRLQIFRYLRRNGPVTRGKMVNDMKIARSTIYDNLLALKLGGYVDSLSERQVERGRPFIKFYLTNKEVKPSVR